MGNRHGKKPYRDYDGVRPSSDRKKDQNGNNQENAQTQSVVAEINKLEKQLGAETFKKLFKSITADGGSEFMDFERIENSSDGNKRTALYFAHPYCASERGTNENHNRIFRRFYPKGTDFSGLNPALFTEVQKWMNDYPRKILTAQLPKKN